VSFLKKKKEKSPREQAKQFSYDGESKHIGKYSIEVIDQELFSLENTKPMFRDSKWLKRTTTIKEEISKKLSRNENSIICQLQFNTLMRILNQR